jgi:hypothetical protein
MVLTPYWFIVLSSIFLTLAGYGWQWFLMRTAVGQALTRFMKAAGEAVQRMLSACGSALGCCSAAGEDKSDKAAAMEAADKQLSSVIVVPDVVSSNEEKVSEADGDQGGPVVADAAADATEAPAAGADPPSSPSAATSSEPDTPAPAPASAPVPRVSVSLPPPADPVFDAAFAPGSSFMYVQVGLQLMHGISILSSLHGDQSSWHRYEEFYARLFNGGCVSLFIPLVLSLNRMVHPRSQKLDLDENAIEHAMNSGGVGHYVLIFLLLSIYPPMFTHLVPSFCFLPVIGLFLVAFKTQDWLAELAKRVPARQRILEQLKAQRDALPTLTAEEKRVYDLTPDLRMFELAASLPPAVVSYRANDVAVDAVGTLHWLPTYARLFFVVVVTTLLNAGAQMGINFTIMLYRGDNYFDSIRREWLLHSTSCYGNTLSAGLRQTVLSFLSYF